LAVEVKRCSKCGIVKEVGSFGRHSQTKDGLRYWCKECNNAAKRADYAAHQERYQEYYKDNYEHRSEVKRIWRNKNPENTRAASHRRRVSVGNIRTADVVANFKFIRNLYQYCLKCNSDQDLTIDHIVSVNNGGTNSIDNLQILCRRCNASKGIKTIDYRSNYVWR
jgi:5-methylcytosine-specific restriction endonuclease McrA